MDECWVLHSQSSVLAHHLCSICTHGHVQRAAKNWFKSHYNPFCERLWDLLWGSASHCHSFQPSSFGFPLQGLPPSPYLLHPVTPPISTSSVIVSSYVCIALDPLPGSSVLSNHLPTASPLASVWLYLQTSNMSWASHGLILDPVHPPYCQRDPQHLHLNHLSSPLCHCLWSLQHHWPHHHPLTLHLKFCWHLSSNTTHMPLFISPGNMQMWE